MRAQLIRLMMGHRISQAISTAVRLGLIEGLNHRAKSLNELAQETGTRAPLLERLLSALVAIELLRVQENGEFELAPLGQLLRRESSGS